MKKYLPVIIALGAPILFIFGVIIYVALLSGTINPQYDFIYTYNDYNAEVLYVDENGTLQLDRSKLQSLIDDKYSRYNIYSERDIKIFRYYVQEDRAEEITLNDTQKIVINNSKQSPDGFAVEYRGSYSTPPIVFGAKSQRGFYIYKDSKSQKINLNENYYYNNIELIGWVAN